MIQSNNIDVYSVKTDAFTIKSSELEKAKTLLNFGSGIGLWRCSKEDGFTFPSSKLTYKNNMEISTPKLFTKVI